MLDINRLFGFVFYTTNPGLFNTIKNVLAEHTTQFDEDDVGIVMGEYYQGSGEITAGIMNHTPLSGPIEFWDVATAVANVISEADINSPKAIIIISDDMTRYAAFEILKMRLFNENYAYPSKIHIVQIHPTAVCEDLNNQWTIVKSTKQFKEEVEKIMKDTNVEY